MKTVRFDKYETCSDDNLYYTHGDGDHSGEYTSADPVRRAIQILKNADIDPPLTGEDAILLADTIKQAINELET